MAVFMAAGPLANLLGAGICLELAAIQERAYPSEARSDLERAWRRRSPVNLNTSLGSWLYLGGALNLLMVVTNLSAGRPKGHPCDGVQLATWLRGGSELERNLMIVNLATALAQGIRPRDWDAHAVAALLQHRYPSAKAVGANLYAYYHAVDSGAFDKACEFLRDALPHADKQAAPTCEALYLEAAFCEGLYRRDAAAARQWLEKATHRLAEEQTRLRAEAAVLLAEGQYAEALARAEAGIAAAPRSTDPGGRIAEADWLGQITVACRAMGSREQQR
jgi:tetratricopeptide (TPR) repeat protein